MKYANVMPDKEIFLSDAVEIAEEFLWCGDDRIHKFYLPAALGKAGWSQFAAVATQLAAASLFPAPPQPKEDTSPNAYVQMITFEAYRKISEKSLGFSARTSTIEDEKASILAVLAYLRDPENFEANISLTKLFLSKA